MRLSFPSFIIAFTLSPLLACVHGDALKPVFPFEASEQLLQSEGGFTVHMHKGNLAKSNFYAISAYPEHTRKLNRFPTRNDLKKYVEEKMSLLTLEENSLGGWCEGKGGTPPCFLDISRTILDRNRALELGRACDQKSVAFLGKDKVEFIEVGGTGEGPLSKECEELRGTRKRQ